MENGKTATLGPVSKPEVVELSGAVGPKSRQLLGTCVPTRYRLGSRQISIST